MGLSVVKNTDDVLIAEPEIHSADVNAKLEEVGQLVQDFRRLQVNYEDALEGEGLAEEVEALERWAESYRRGLKAAVKISENGQEMLEDVRKRLKLAADELTRISSESPNPAPKGEAKKAEAFLEATRTIDAILPTIGSAVMTNENRADDKNSNPPKGE